MIARLCAATLGVSAILLVGPSSAEACSLCIANSVGSGVHGVGAQTLPHGTLVASWNTLTFDKSNATEDPGGRESHRLYQTGLGLNYGLTDQLMVRVDVPYAWHSMRETGMPRERSHGFGDVTLGAFYQLKARPNDKVLTGVFVDVKVPTGPDSRRDGGQLLEQHLQPGSGSTDVTAGVSVTGEIGHRGQLWFASLRGRANGSNSRDYHYGDAFFYRAGYAHPVGPKTSVVVELDGRLSEKDTMDDGDKDGQSGGHALFGAVSVRHSLSRDYGVIAGYQALIANGLNGSQREGALYTFSISRRFR